MTLRESTSEIVDSYKKKRIKTLDQIKTEVDEILSFSNHIDFNGGEPTLNKDLLEILKYADSKKENLEIGLLTNSRMFSNRNYAQRFREIKSRQFKVVTSIYGHSPELHDSITRTPGSFIQQLQGIRNLIELGVKIDLRIVINQLNVNHLDKIAEFISSSFSPGYFLRITLINMKLYGIALKNSDITSYRITAAVPWVEKCAFKLIENGFPLSLFHFPHCCLPKYLWKFSAGLTAEKSQIVFLNQCMECLFSKKCSGVWREYVRVFGTDEFKTIL
jgi:organic radical activating enzyme